MQHFGLGGSGAAKPTPAGYLFLPIHFFILRHRAGNGKGAAVTVARCGNSLRRTTWKEVSL